MKMSLVVPCYNEEEAIPIFYREALKVIEQLKDEFEFEFCFVDDVSVIVMDVNDTVRNSGL